MSAAKISTTKARAPRGFADREAADLRAIDRMCAKIREVYELYGFDPVETPFVEFTDALGKFLPDQDRPNEGVFSFQDDDEQWLSLRYDLTAPLARYVAENYERLAKPHRSYRAGWVFRNEKPGPGRLRQFMQFDADTVGAGSVAADAEICMMAADTMEALGIRRGDYVIKVNNRKVLDGVMEAVGLGGAENAGRRLTVLRAIDKLDRLGGDGVRQLLGAGRKDESGDFTKGAGLDGGEIAMLTRVYMPKASLRQLKDNDTVLQSDVRSEDLAGQQFARADNELTIANMRDLLPKIGIAADGLNELEQLSNFAANSNYGPDRLQIDPSIVRGLEYYTGPVFEAQLTFDITGEDGRKVQFGSVGGGGRYDGLVSRFRGEAVPATGFSIGVSRLYDALKLIKSPIVADAALPGPVVVLVLDRDRVGDYQRMVSWLRNAGIRAEMYLGSSGMKPQMKYADRRGAPAVIIQGGDEKAKGEVQIKDLIEGARQASASASASHADYKAARPAQETVPENEDDIVAAVRRILEGQGRA